MRGKETLRYLTPLKPSVFPFSSTGKLEFPPTHFLFDSQHSPLQEQKHQQMPVFSFVRVRRIELLSFDWQPNVLPLNHTRNVRDYSHNLLYLKQIPSEMDITCSVGVRLGIDLSVAKRMVLDM